MSLTLGPSPDTLFVRLVRDATWWSTLTLLDDAGDPQDFEVGDVLELRFGDPVDATWPATITGADAVWSVASSVVNTLLDAAPRSVGLWLTSGGRDIPWALGQVVVDA